MTEVATSWTTRLAELAETAVVPGAVLGVWADGTLTVTPYGVLSKRTGVETTPDSVFQIGSITKTWTATMVVQLVEEGRLTYDTTVAGLLPGVRLGRDDVADRVTVRHLLTHSSGIDGDIFDDTGRGDEAVEKYVALLADAQRAFEPGAAYSYCNSGFVVLGRIIEVLDGRSWDESLRARLVEPLGLTDTVTLSEDAILRRVAVGHKGPADDAAPYGAWALPRSAGPAGIITTTAADLLTYARMHIDRGVGGSGDRLLSEESALAMRDLQLPIPDNPLYSGVGLSWRVATWSGTMVLAHDGGTIGQIAALRVLPERGVAVCVLSNGDNGDAVVYPLIREVLREVAGVETPALPEPDPLAAPSGLERHAGRYERKGVAFEVAADEDDRLEVTVLPHFGLPGVDDDSETIQLLPLDETGDRFVGRSDPAEQWWPVTFATLPDGRAQLYSSGRVAPRV
jgi:CubicO group peptidase (beta-lactamase class C family)